MSSSRDEYGTIRKYLLGQLAGEERNEFEQRYFADDELFEDLQAAEENLIDDFLTGDLSEDEVAMFHEHFSVGTERDEMLQISRAWRSYAERHGEEQSSKENKVVVGEWNWQQLFSSGALRMAAFAAIVIIAGLGIWRTFFFTSDVDKALLALNSAYRQQRPLESRITQLNYAPFVTTRGLGSDVVDQNELNRAELTLLDALKTNPTPAVRHALGKVVLTKREFDRAIKLFDEALKGDPNNAQPYADLGAAYLEKAKIDLEKGRVNPESPDSGKGLEELVHSLEALNKALAINPNLLEARFNRALVYEAMVLPKQAVDEWTRYLEQDRNSEWANEARRRLDQLHVKTKLQSQNKGDLLSEFIGAQKSNNDNRAFDLISKNTDALTGQLVWWRLAGAYLDAASIREGGPAQSYLESLVYAGKLQQQRTGDLYISDLAKYFASCSFETHVVLAGAHQSIDEAHARMAKSDVAGALKLYQNARDVFDKAGDKWESLFAQYWIGYSYQRSSKFDLSIAALSPLAEYCESKGYLWLLEKTLTMIGVIRGELNQFSTALAYQNQALETSRKVNDIYNVQKVLNVLAHYYKNLGNRPASLVYLQQGLESANSYWPGARQMYRNYYTTAGVLNAFGYYAAAAEYEKAALSLALGDAKDPGFEHQCYVALAAIYGQMKDYDQAQSYADLSYQAAKKLDAQSSARPVAESHLQLAHVNRLRGKYETANSHYDEAVKLYKEMDLFAFLYEAHKGRLLGYIAQEDYSKAGHALPVVLQLFEEHRSKIREEKNRNSFFDLEHNVYDIAIDFEYSRTQNYERAYDYSEVSRARSLFDLMNAPVSQPLTLSGIQDRIPAEAQVIQYAVLEDKVLIWVISKDKFDVAESMIAAGVLTAKVVDYYKLVSDVSGRNNEELRRASTELYGILIQPVESLLKSDKQICIVPDKVLNGLPFNALISPATGRYLISDHLLSFAPSSNIFVECSRVAGDRSVKTQEHLLSVGHPNFDREAFPDLADLPSSGQEALQIAAYYDSPPLIGNQATKNKVMSEMDNADVIHIASHYVIDEYDPLHSKLLLTTNGREDAQSTDDILKAYEIANRKLPVTRLVVLSACRTGVERYYSGEGMIGMSRPFLAAGVPLVVASLWPVASEPTGELMTNFHRQRKVSHLATARALRQAQLDMLNDARHRYDHPSYWAPFVLIGGYATF